MPQLRPSVLSRYLLYGQIAPRGCLRTRTHHSTSAIAPPRSTSQQIRALHAEAGQPVENPTPTPLHVPLRKQLKDEAKQRKSSGKKKKKNINNQVVDGWELTVGIEIHAQLNTARKLFSGAHTSSLSADPNTHVAYFDVATPGSQPIFQRETLIPALRAALALNCAVQPVSRFDRKHYFHWDQPSGYQITQYYEPFARDGSILLSARDGIAAEDGEGGVVVDIERIQLEQDTAKTLAQAGNVHWIDFNRVGTPLIEIITRPVIHHPATAAAFVRKVQTALHAVDACVSGMEAGGLRADVNVSVRRTDDPNEPLGQRVEIKNLSSFRSVEDAIIDERDRQIALLSAGGKVEGETRGWSIGSTETRRLRGKEGEVDYRYMPDPDVPPLVIGGDLVAHLRESMGLSPDAVIDGLVADFGLTTKDAMSLVALDGGLRVEYFYNVVELLRDRFAEGNSEPTISSSPKQQQQIFLSAANWTLHEFGRLAPAEDYSNAGSSTLSTADDDASSLSFTQEGECPRVPAVHLADLLYMLHTRQITGKVAKETLQSIFNGDISSPLPESTTTSTTTTTYPTVQDFIDGQGLRFRELSAEGYAEAADRAVEDEDDIVRLVFESDTDDRRTKGKLGYLVGRMLKGSGQEGSMDAAVAESVMRERIVTVYGPALAARKTEGQED